MKIVINEFQEGITLSFERQRQERPKLDLTPGSVNYISGPKLRITIAAGDTTNVCEVDAEKFFAGLEMLK